MFISITAGLETNVFKNSQQNPNTKTIYKPTPNPLNNKKPL